MSFPKRPGHAPESSRALGQTVDGTSARAERDLSKTATALAMRAVGWAPLQVPLQVRKAKVDVSRENPLYLLVGATGFEPAAPCAQGRCATRLRYAPTSKTP
jgi:hypothetical protein